MLSKSLLTVSFLSSLLFSTAVSAQTTNPTDPACIIKNADGTQKVDMLKCPDGKKISAAQIPADTTKNAADLAKTPDVALKSSAEATKTPDDSASGKADVDKTIAVSAAASTSNSAGDILVSPDKMTGEKLLSANDFIGKTVYSRANEKVGKVDDLILSENGVQAVVLGVGGFLGMGTKDVAVMLSSIEIAKDGTATKLVVDASKDQLKAAPTYDPKIRTYMN